MTRARTLALGLVPVLVALAYGAALRGWVAL